MAISQDFNTMLNEVVTSDLIENDIKKKSYIIDNIDIKKDWQSVTYALPITSAFASSVSFGSLTDVADVSSDAFGRGQASKAEIYGTLAFKEADIFRHGKVNIQNFVNVLPDRLEPFTKRFANIISSAILNGAAYDVATADGDVSGNITVSRPEFFEIGMKVQVNDNNSSAVTGYVLTVNLNTNVINLVTARGGAIPVDLSGYTVAQNAKVYNDNQQSNSFTSLKDIIVPASLGGAASVFGLSKTSSPYYQGICVSGSLITAANIMSKIFDHYVTVSRIAKGGANTVLMSFKNFGSCVKNVESSKGSFFVIPGKDSASQYGWTELTIGGFAGKLKIIGVPEMMDDSIYFLDMSVLCLATNQFIVPIKSPDGNMYYTARATTGYTYYVDFRMEGNLIVKKPINNLGAITSISY